jgi:hypothetical protein
MHPELERANRHLEVARAQLAAVKDAAARSPYVDVAAATKAYNEARAAVTFWEAQTTLVPDNDNHSRKVVI